MKTREITEYNKGIRLFGSNLMIVIDEVYEDYFTFKVENGLWNSEYNFIKKELYVYFTKDTHKNIYI